MEVLLTGATGLLGSHVLKGLLNMGDYDRIHLLVRDVTRAEKLLEPQASTSRVVFHKGDLTQENLGLSSEALQELQNLDQVFHCAANVTLSSSPAAEQELQDTNVTGTKNLINLVQNNKNATVYFVSTGYAAGVIPDKVKEDWLPKPSHFRNPYEKSKWEAEQVIKELHEKEGTSFVIFRPTILVSDYEEDRDKLSKQTVYLYMNIVNNIIGASNEEKQTLKLLGEANAPLNFVTVSHVSKVIEEVLKNKIINKIFNIANQQTISAQVITEILEENLNQTVSFEFRPELDKEELSETEMKLAKLTGAFSKYLLEQSTTWETNNTQGLNNKEEGIDEDWLRAHLKNYLKEIRQ